jgi:hypothetical protein
MIAFFSLVRDDWAAKRESKISGDVRNSTRDDLKRRTTFNAAGASGVIRSMNPGFCSIIPETRTKRRLIDKQGSDTLVKRLNFSLNRILELRFNGSGVHLNAIGLEELNGLKSILSRSGVEANLLDNVTMEIVEINHMGQRLIKTCR